ncbi:MAG: hypothetical protein VKJ04_06530 [Vampirovibrionales bacterium]|nr:hypothetical protein [Vampirovibrionales bacterium]
MRALLMTIPEHAVLPPVARVLARGAARAGEGAYTHLPTGVAATAGRNAQGAAGTAVKSPEAVSLTRTGQPRFSGYLA